MIEPTLGDLWTVRIGGSLSTVAQEPEVYRLTWHSHDKLVWEGQRVTATGTPILATFGRQALVERVDRVGVGEMVAALGRRIDVLRRKSSKK